MIAAVLVVLWTWWGWGITPVAPPSPIPALPDTLDLARGVRDPVFALLIALVEDDYFGVLSRERLLREIKISGRSTPWPVREFVEIRREPGSGPEKARVSIRAERPIAFPAPYKVLVYHPGRIRGSATTSFLEWRLGDVRVEPGAPGELESLEDVRLWALIDGSLELDVDGWVDAVLGGKLDDTWITGLALFRERGEWMGVALGYNHDGRRRSGVFRFRDEKVLVPTPDPYRSAVRYLRSQLERRVPPPVSAEHR